MGDNTTYKVNDDGSVTIAQQLSEHEQNILEIFRIEKTKGGPFTSRRMKKRALKYAKSVNYPEFKIEKLMLDNYPEDFKNYPKTHKLIMLLCMSLFFLLGSVILIYPAYFEYERARYYITQKNAIEEYLQLGHNVEYPSYIISSIISSSETSLDELNSRLIDVKSYRNERLRYMALYVFGIIFCIVIFCMLIKEYFRVTKSINSKSI